MTRTLTAVEKNSLEHFFKYHPPVSGQPDNYSAIRSAGKKFAKVVLANTPVGPDQALAVRRIRETVMIANAAVALSERGV